MPTASTPTGIQNWISVKIAFSISGSLTLVVDAYGMTRAVGVDQKTV
jgi:hypothetical protein